MLEVINHDEILHLPSHACIDYPLHGSRQKASGSLAA